MPVRLRCFVYFLVLALNVCHARYFSRINLGLCSALRSFWEAGCFKWPLFVVLFNSFIKREIQCSAELKTLFKFALFMHLMSVLRLEFVWMSNMSILGFKIDCKCPHYRITPTCLKPWQKSSWVIDYWPVLIWRAGDWHWGDLWSCFRFRTSLSGQIWSVHVRLGCVKTSLLEIFQDHDAENSCVSRKYQRCKC